MFKVKHAHRLAGKGLLITLVLLVLSTLSALSAGALASGTNESKIDPIWIEGESAVQHNFTTIKQASELSNGSYLELATKTPPDLSGYTAKYEFNVTSAGDYYIWIASTPLNWQWSSPAAWRLDDGAWVDGSKSVPAGSLFGPAPPSFAWTRVGNVHLAAGSHRLSFKVTRGRSYDQAFYFYIDAIMLIQNGALVPSGPGLPKPKPKAAAAASGSQITTDKYMWVEGENSFGHNFSSVYSAPEFSNGGSLLLATKEKPDENGYYANYRFNVPKPGSYYLWIGSTPFAWQWSSPVLVKMDSGAYEDLKGLFPEGDLYGPAPPSTAWTQVGPYDLAAGEHVVQIKAVEPRSYDSQYFIYIDALFLTSDESVFPDGSKPPQ